MLCLFSDCRCIVQFENGIFGKALTAEEKQAYLDKKYGGAKASGLDLIEDVAMLELGGIAEKPAEKSQAPPKIASPQQAPVRPQANGSTAQSEKGGYLQAIVTFVHSELSKIHYLFNRLVACRFQSIVSLQSLYLCGK